MPKNIPLVLSVFVCGAVVMIFELAGSRVMAPYFGTSIYVWTALIGVILGSLSLGYWLGGRVADKRADEETYALIIFISGLAVFWAFLARDFVFLLFAGQHMPIELSSFLSSLLLFAPASIALGFISPYAVRLKTVKIERAASTVGNLYAASTVGSIVGTFVAGYWLIPFVGTVKILFLLTGLLIILSFVFSRKHFVLKIVALAVISAIFYFILHNSLVVEQKTGEVSFETEYNSINIHLGTDEATGRPARYLSFDPYALQGAMYLDSDELVWDYTKFYRLADHFSPGTKKALMIGGGAYSYPKDFLAKHEDSAMDVVEIDPGITAAARKYFRLADDPRLRIFDEDARTFINFSKEKYDAIFDDAFSSATTAPFQLTSIEAVRKQYDLLNDGGVVIANVGASINGPNGRFLRAEAATFAAVFPQVYIFPMTHPFDPNRVQNIMIAALKTEKPAVFSSDNKEFNAYLQHVWKQPLAADVPILTDDHAPIEYYMKGIM